MTIQVTNAQRRLPVGVRRMSALARCAAKRLRIRTPGRMVITFVDARRMRSINRRFLRHDHTTDVLSFRYDGEPIVGEILIDPAMARHYAKAHGVPYQVELARYVVHGLLHWLGHEDRTRAEQQAMRSRENRLLAACGATR